MYLTSFAVCYLSLKPFYHGKLNRKLNVLWKCNEMHAGSELPDRPHDKAHHDFLSCLSVFRLCSIKRPTFLTSAKIPSAGEVV